MGAWPSTPQIQQPDGCWYYQWPDHSMVIGQKGAAQGGPVLTGDYIDCDCVTRGQCADGEPPPPPLAEFAMDPRIRPGMKDEMFPAHEPYLKIPGGHSYRPPTSPLQPPYLHGVLEGTKFDMTGEPFGHNVKKRGLDENSSPSEPTPIPVLSAWEFPRAVVRAYHRLSSGQQAAILHYWPAFGPIVKNLTANFDANTQELDPRPVIAILVADPAGPGGDAVRLMDRKWANFLVQCAWQTFSRHAPSMRSQLRRLAAISEELRKKEECERKSLEDAKEQMRQDMTKLEGEYMRRRKGVVQDLDETIRQKFPDIDAIIPEAAPEKKPRDPDELAGQYLDVITHFQKAWRTNLPSELTLRPVEGDRFMISQDRDGDGSSLSKMKSTKPRVAIPKYLDTVWDSVHNPDATFAVDVDYVVASLHQQLEMFGNTNPFLKSLGIREKMDSFEYELDWREDALCTVFNDTFPQLQLSMSFFALTMWTGLDHY